MSAAPIPGATDLERLVARTRLLGADRALVVHGGGNTSTKTRGADHLGRDRRMLLVKGSGSDMATATSASFAALWLDELEPARTRDAMSDDEMVRYLACCTADPGGPRPSIETLLHAFLPAAHVDHVHADAICALTNHPGGRRAVEEALGSDVAYVPYVRPGFALSRRVGELASARAVVLAHHGLVTWGATPEASVGVTLDLVERATAYLTRRAARPAAGAAPPAWSDEDRDALLVTLRGRLSRGTPKILCVDADQRAVADRDDVDRVAAAGPATADHVLRLGPGSVVIRARERADDVVDRYAADYEAYVRRHADRLPPGQAPHEPLPRAFLVPGVGCVAAGRNAAAARITADVAARTHAVAAAVLDAFAEAEPLSEPDLFDIDYWPLELRKLAVAVAPPELEGRIAVVTGAASGIGRAVATDLAARGAHLVIADRDGTGLDALGVALPAERVTAVAGDLTDERVVDAVVTAAVRTFGGLDALVCSAGVAVAGAIAELDAERWRRALDVNATADFLLTRRAWPVLERQGLGGSLVYVVSKNALAPGAGFAAYSASKAAQLQLARVAALEGGPLGIRANVVNPDAVFDGSGLWSPQVRAERAAAHGVAVEELEAFYARRSLLGRNVTPGDVAEAVAFLVSDRSRASTGCIVPVDAGVAAAFPR